MDSSTLSGILKQKRKLGLKTAQALMCKLQLTEEQRRDVVLEMAGIADGHSAHEEATVLKEDIFECIAGWEHYAILSLTELADFRSDVRWIAKQLGIGTGQVHTAVGRLLKLGMLEEVDGKLRCTQKLFVTSEDIPSAVLRRANAECIQLGLEALENVPVDRRDVSGSTLAISKKKVPHIKEMIRKFRRQVTNAAASSGPKDSVYRLNVQFFPMTKGMES
jgi:uncharacterized protein (TIGR02147 family)